MDAASIMCNAACWIKLTMQLVFFWEWQAWRSTCIYDPIKQLRWRIIVTSKYSCFYSTTTMLTWRTLRIQWHASSSSSHFWSRVYVMNQPSNIKQVPMKKPYITSQVVVTFGQPRYCAPTPTLAKCGGIWINKPRVWYWIRDTMMNPQWWFAHLLMESWWLLQHG